jgi:Eukaryotic translation initiation factor 3 subunit G
LIELNAHHRWLLAVLVEKKRLVELYSQMKLEPLNFHSTETFGKFIRFRLNLMQYWIDRNKQHGFVYQTMPKVDEECFMNIYEILTQHEQQQQQEEEQQQQQQREQKIPPPIRCDLCKFYGHLSHTCTVKEVRSLCASSIFFLIKFSILKASI